MTALDCKNLLLVYSNFPKNRNFHQHPVSRKQQCAAAVSLQTGRKAWSKGFPVGRGKGHMSHCIKLWVLFVSRAEPDIGTSPFLNAQKMSFTAQDSWKTYFFPSQLLPVTSTKSDKSLICFNPNSTHRQFNTKQSPLLQCLLRD